MSLMQSEDVEALIRLLAQVANPNIDMPIKERKLRLLEGLGKLIDADAWTWGLSQVSGSEPSDNAPYAIVDGGWQSEEQRVNVFRLITGVEPVPRITAPIDNAVAERRSVTYSRDQLISGGTWLTSAFGQKWRGAGFDEFIISVYPIGEGFCSGCGFHRHVGKQPYTERERMIVHVMFQQIDWLHRAGSDVPASKKVIDLSPRERQIVLLLMGGDSRKQVAAKLQLSEHTVATYLKEIHRKFGVHSRAELLAQFIPGGN